MDIIDITSGAVPRWVATCCWNGEGVSRKKKLELETHMMPILFVNFAVLGDLTMSSGWVFSIKVTFLLDECNLNRMQHRLSFSLCEWKVWSRQKIHPQFLTPNGETEWSSLSWFGLLPNSMPYGREGQGVFVGPYTVLRATVCTSVGCWLRDSSEYIIHQPYCCSREAGTTYNPGDPCREMLGKDFWITFMARKAVLPASFWWWINESLIPSQNSSWRSTPIIVATSFMRIEWRGALSVDLLKYLSLVMGRLKPIEQRLAWMIAYRRRILFPP